MFWAAIAVAWTLQVSLHALDTLGMHAFLQHCSIAAAREPCALHLMTTYLESPQAHSCLPYPIDLGRARD